MKIYDNLRWGINNASRNWGDMVLYAPYTLDTIFFRNRILDQDFDFNREKVVLSYRYKTEQVLNKKDIRRNAFKMKNLLQIMSTLYNGVCDYCKELNLNLKAFA